MRTIPVIRTNDGKTWSTSVNGDTLTARGLSSLRREAEAAAGEEVAFRIADTVSVRAVVDYQRRRAAWLAEGEQLLEDSIVISAELLVHGYSARDCSALLGLSAGRVQQLHPGTKVV